MLAEKIEYNLKCYHCGQPCDEVLWLQEKSFCCYGCKTVFEILDANNLCEYYNFDTSPGIHVKNAFDESYTYLDESGIRKKILTFDSDTFAKVTFYVPAIHCVSCIWLLENLRKIDTGILRSEVNFSGKSVSIDFNPQKTKLSCIARLLASIGYMPRINLDKDKPVEKKIDRSLVFKLSIAGFCFGNVMLFSFPEYLGLDHADQHLMRMFSWLNLALSVPVFFYSGFDYLRSAIENLRQKQVGIDIPIAAGLVALFLRSSYDIISSSGPGYLDSFTGLVFFLLIGRWFQNKTYESLAFDRDFTSYFPLAVQKLTGQEWEPTLVYKLNPGDHIKIRNMEIVPADSVLLDEHAFIDYSFVTGESRPVEIKKSTLIYAGGRLVGKPVSLMVEKKTSQSHLTSLWNNEAFRKIEVSKYQKIIDRAARRFTWIVLVIALSAAVYWYLLNPVAMWLVLTSVLMVACPCALALAAPFTYGSMLRVFGRHKLYLKNAAVIERMATIDAVVFDKTGTVTHERMPNVQFTGTLSEKEYGWIKILTSYSTHPLSNLITISISGQTSATVKDFRELPGNGIEGIVDGHLIRIGSSFFVGNKQKTDNPASYVFVSVDDQVRGYFSIRISVRKNIKAMLDRLGNKCAALLSGDNETDKREISTLFSSGVQLIFNQSPHDKLDFIRDLQQQGKKVMMVGDGLNDAGALKQSNVGISVTDDAGVFTPACDGILDGEKINLLDKFLELAKASVVILKTGFIISFLYNAIALSFAVTGHLTPLVAAVLMPLSSISVVGFTSLAVNYVAKQKFKD